MAKKKKKKQLDPGPVYCRGCEEQVTWTDKDMYEHLVTCLGEGAIGDDRVCDYFYQWGDVPEPPEDK